MTSWFSELTSKAEAMLIKLDQDAAQALQRPDGLLADAKLLDDETNDEPPNNLAGVQVSTTMDDSEGNTGHRQNLDHTTVKDNDENYELNCLPPKPPIIKVPIIPNNQNLDHQNLLLDYDGQQETNVPEKVHESDQAYQESGALITKEPKTYRKFKIQTSSNSTSLFRSSKVNNREKSGISHTRELILDGNDTTRNRQRIEYFEADDIRASINRSLQEYVTQSDSNISKAHLSIDPEPNSTHQHFDNRPIVVKHSSKNQRDVSSSSPIKQSSSFSIQVPEDVSTTDPTDVAAKLLKQHSVLRKKSPIYIHRVLNSLAGIDNNSESLISDQTRLKFRRVKLRAASYARRLNYYFRVYPKLKYVVLGYILLMQLLVVYVLFFYQSTGLATELSSQVRQQQELVKSGVDRSQIPGGDEAKLARQLV